MEVRNNWFTSKEITTKFEELQICLQFLILLAGLMLRTLNVGSRFLMLIWPIRSALENQCLVYTNLQFFDYL